MSLVRLAGALRIKNEEEWIVESIESLLPICYHVYVLDDHSSDRTVELVEQIGKQAPGRVTIWRSPFEEKIDEKRDKDWLLRQAMSHTQPEWILLIDGDEVLEGKGCRNVLSCASSEFASVYSLQIAYLWDRTDQIRVDGIYGDFWRPSLFKTKGSHLRFRATENGGNFHCSSAPADLLDQGFDQCNARLKHYGYLRSEQRVRKFHWYNSVDPDNLGEDRYRHMVAGDLPEVPADLKTKHAGPVRFAPWP